MSFDTQYPQRKDQRQPYYGAGRHARSCRPGGSCPACQQNRSYASRKRQDAAHDAQQDWRLERDPR